MTWQDILKIDLAEQQRLGHAYAQSDMAEGRQEPNEQEKNTIRDLLSKYIAAKDETMAKQLFDKMRSMLTKFDVSNLIDNNHASMDIRLKNMEHIQRFIGD